MRPYPVTVRLCETLADYYVQIDAAYYQRNILREPLDRALGWVYTWVLERLGTPEKITAWQEELHEMLPWQDIESETAINLESESFFAAAAKGGG